MFLLEELFRWLLCSSSLSLYSSPSHTSKPVNPPLSAWVIIHASASRRATFHSVLIIESEFGLPVIKACFPMAILVHTSILQYPSLETLFRKYLNCVTCSPIALLYKYLTYHTHSHNFGFLNVNFHCIFLCETVEVICKMLQSFPNYLPTLLSN